MTIPEAPLKASSDGRTEVRYPGTVNPFRFSCPKRLCEYSGMFENEALRDERAANHPCPTVRGTTTLSWAVAVEERIEPIWKQLDLVVDSIADQQDAELAGVITDHGISDLRSRARGIAIALALLMPPFFTTPDDIAREAGRRRKARVEGNVDYETPGLGRLRFNPPSPMGEYNPTP